MHPERQARRLQSEFQRSRLATLLLALVISAPANAQTLETAPAAEELTRLLNDFLAGASRNDIATHQRFWADDLIYTRSAGVRIGKAEILRSLRAEPEAPGEPAVDYAAEDIRIQQYGDTAVVAFRLVGRSAGERAASMQFLNTGTFVKRNGEWRAVAWQATKIPEPGDTPKP
jgi:ketosteroid isomerase-like protein